MFSGLEWCEAPDEGPARPGMTAAVTGSDSFHSNLFH